MNRRGLDVMNMTQTQGFEPHHALAVSWQYLAPRWYKWAFTQLCHEKTYFFMVVQSLSFRFWAPSNTPRADIAFPILMTSAITPQFSKSDYITSQCQHLVLRYAVATSHNSLLVVLSQNSLSQSYESRWLPPCRCLCIFVLKRVFYRSSPCWALAVSVTGPRVISRDRPSSLRNASSDHTDNIRFISVFLKLEARFQIGAIRPIRVDHIDSFKWPLKLFHSLLVPNLTPLSKLQLLSYFN